MDSLSQIYNYLPLGDHLLTSGQPTRAQFADVAEAGVRTVINLALPTSTNALPDEGEVVAGLGMGYHHIPVVWESPSQAALAEFMDTMDEHKNEKVLVHCAANMRVSAFVALYRILRLGWSREQAFADLQRIWDPEQDPVWGAFVAEALGTGLESPRPPNRG